MEETDILVESVVYQDIFQKGLQKGWRRVAMRQLERRFGKLPRGVREQIEGLALTQLEELFEALLDFQTRRDMLAWFKQQPAKA